MGGGHLELEKSRYEAFSMVYGLMFILGENATDRDLRELCEDPCSGVSKDPSSQALRSCAQIC